MLEKFPPASSLTVIATAVSRVIRRKTNLFLKIILFIGTERPVLRDSNGFQRILTDSNGSKCGSKRFQMDSNGFQQFQEESNGSKSPRTLS